MNLFRQMTLVAGIVTATAAAAQTAPEWRPFAVADPQNSAAAALASSDGRSSLVVKCDKGASFANMSFRFVPAAELGVGDMPLLYERDSSPDNFPFEQLWSRIPDRAAYLDWGQNGELAEALAALLAFDDTHFVVDAQDKAGTSYRQEFTGSTRKLEHVNAVFAKCHGKTLRDFHPLSRSWSLEQGKTAAGRPIYTAWLPSVDMRASIGVRCTYTDSAMKASIVVKSIHGGFLIGSPPTLVSGEEVVDLPFQKLAPNQWEWTDEDGAIEFAQALMQGGAAITLRQNHASNPRGTVFALPVDSSTTQIRSAMTMCNIPI